MASESSTFGAVAYEAFTQTLGAHVLAGDEEACHYGKLPPKARHAWEAAAEAVVTALNLKARLAARAKRDRELVEMKQTLAETKAEAERRKRERESALDLDREMRASPGRATDR